MILTIPEIIEAIKDLGGWGVVVWIVVWLTRKWEKKQDAQLKIMQDLITGMQEHQNNEILHRKEVILKQEELHITLKDFLSRLNYKTNE